VDRTDVVRVRSPTAHSSQPTRGGASGPNNLELSPDQLPIDPQETVDNYWKPISAEQLERRNTQKPLTHRLARLPNVSKRSGRVLGPINGLLVDG
jgi:hypothetical protein